MSTRSADYREAIDHLPPGAILVLQDVPWEAYEQLLEDLRDRSGVRVTYDQGRVEIMSPLRRHEKYKEFIGDLIKALADEYQHRIIRIHDLEKEKRREGGGRGSQLSYCKRGTGRGEGRARFERRSGARPVVEIDITNESLSKFSIYATFGVPEIWRYADNQKFVVMYVLRNNAYMEIEASRSFPMLTPDLLARFIEQGHTEGQKKALGAFRCWLRSR